MLVPELTLDYRLRWMDFDRYGSLRPAAALDIFQDVATVQASTMDLGYEAMASQGVFWALVRQKYEVVKNPDPHQKILVRTWPYNPSRFAFLRDYTIADEEGNPLVKATSEWMLMDIVERKLAKVSDYFTGDYAYAEDRNFPEKLKKIPWPGGVQGATYSVVPSFEDIDVNGHVNNSCYPTYVMDAINPGPEKRLKTFQIDYRREALQGEPLEITLVETADVTFAQGLSADGEIIFITAMGWES